VSLRRGQIGSQVKTVLQQPFAAGSLLRGGASGTAAQALPVRTSTCGYSGACKGRAEKGAGFALILSALAE